MGFIAGMVKIIVGQNGPKQNAVRLLHNHITAKKNIANLDQRLVS
jgi:hypothetical protein